MSSCCCFGEASSKQQHVKLVNSRQRFGSAAECFLFPPSLPVGSMLRFVTYWGKSEIVRRFLTRVEQCVLALPDCVLHGVPPKLDYPVLSQWLENNECLRCCVSDCYLYLRMNLIDIDHANSFDGMTCSLRMNVFACIQNCCETRDPCWYVTCEKVLNFTGYRTLYICIATWPWALARAPFDAVRIPHVKTFCACMIDSIIAWLMNWMSALILNGVPCIFHRE